MAEAALRNLTIKPAVMSQLRALDPKDNQIVQSKLELLVNDPLPDGKAKKRLQHIGGKLCRARAGDQRIFYTFDDRFVSVLRISKRDEGTYDDPPAPEFLSGLVVDEPPPVAAKPNAGAAKLGGKKANGTPLPEPITAALLESLQVPAEYRRALLACHTEEELYGADDVPEAIRLAVADALAARPIQTAVAQPDFLVSNAEDLFKFKEGELLGFLLKLDPDQERFVTWALEAKGPTLVKGAPGTGKSTVALYRVKAMLDRLAKAGVEKPRVLFTTYTNALVTASEQLLAQLLGERSRFVEVRTADSLVTLVTARAGHRPNIASAEEQLRALGVARERAELLGNKVERAAQTQALDRLSPDYLLEEFTGVIDARAIDSLEAYLVAPRPGRKVALGAVQRRAVWAVRQAWMAELAAVGKKTFAQSRVKAAEVVQAGQGPAPYDAVVVDEAQDLDPVVLGMLVRLCAEPNRLFLTADADQSIYGSGFRWSDVHSSLKFQGRTGVLRRNHRSTARIGRAARSYLGGGALDEEAADEQFVHDGEHPPVLGRPATPDAEADLVARFCRGAAKELHLTLGACAVLAPARDVGRAIAERLTARGVAATFMDSKSLNLNQPGVKVITLQAAKGLEFPAVALAGFGSSTYPALKPDASEEAKAEALARAHRTVFVGMTRAMRLLLVAAPPTPNALVDGFDPELWHEV